MQNDSIPESSMWIIIKSVFIIDKTFVVELWGKQGMKMWWAKERALSDY